MLRDCRLAGDDDDAGRKHYDCQALARKGECDLRRNSNTTLDQLRAFGYV